MIPFFLLPAFLFVCGEEEVTLDILYSMFCIRWAKLQDVI
jgi:hypothetical protein